MRNKLSKVYLKLIVSGDYIRGCIATYNTIFFFSFRSTRALCFDLVFTGMSFFMKIFMNSYNSSYLCQTKQEGYVVEMNLTNDFLGNCALCALGILKIIKGIILEPIL